MPAEFAVVDVETTGLSPGHHHRIVEVAVVRLRRDLTVADEYATLVNPRRDIGSTSLHGISASDVADAPTFEEIAGDLCDRFEGAVLCGHNAAFDERFLRAEFERVGFELEPLPYICTLRLAASVPPFRGGTLGDCCGVHGIESDNWHSALDDAHAAAKLFRCVASKLESPSLESLGMRGRWPYSYSVNAQRTGRTLKRSEASRLREGPDHYLARLVFRLGNEMSAATVGTDLLVYLELLERVLEDRHVTEEEGNALLETARGVGLSVEQVLTAHRELLNRLADAALADGVVSEAEMQDLLGVSRMLGFSKDQLHEALTTASSRVPQASNRESFEGRTVCFTGENVCTIRGELITRELAQDLAASKGLIVKNSVTKALDLLVVADPNTQSGKAKTARKYGTRILAEHVFWSAIGVETD